MTTPLSDALVASYRGKGLRPSATLEEELRRMTELGHARWPEVRLDPATFARYIGERLPEGAEPQAALQGLHASDLYLACACALGDPAAIAALDREFLAEVPRWLRPTKRAAHVADEVQQLLREKLLVSVAGEAPRIAGYSGQGSVGAWLRVVAVRTALNLGRGRKEETLNEETSSDGPLPAGIDPELDYLKVRYGRSLEEALRGAFADLAAPERAMLSLYFLDELTLDQIAALYHVHASTVSRRLSRARELLYGDTRRRLREALSLSETELDSLVQLAQSRVHVSLHALLGNKK
jgi:RNA polymerase sigma-70 factor (ECF subfamily)